MPFGIGENVGPYRIVEQLGQGGMATVFRAYHPALDRYVAIKVLHPAFTQDPNFLARFQREAKVVARLEHPSIVPVYDFAEKDGKPYLVLKFVEGETLKARMSRGPLSVSEGLRVVEAVGAALTYAHRQGVLHRDIKPSNVLLASDGGIFLADFGLARIAAAGESTLSSDMLLGTPQYISPEQARGDRDLNPGTDIYSFGVVLYEMVVGRVPFNADTPFSIIHDHIYTPLPLPSLVNPLVPEAVERVLLKALAKDRADRFTSVDALVGAFRGAVGGGDAARGDAHPAVKAIAPARPVAPSEAAPGVGRSDGEPGVESSDGKKRRRLSRKAWIAVGLACVFACICLGLLAAASKENRQAAAVTQAPPAADGAAEVLASDEQVKRARLAVEADPESPVPRIELAAALRDNGQPRLAYSEFVKAGNLFLAGGRHPDAAAAYLQALSLPLASGERADSEVIARAEQALFLSAPDQRALDLVQEARALAPEWPTLQTLEARAQLFAGQKEVATLLTSQVLEERPEDPLARAVQVELLVQNGAVDQARALAEETARLTDLPPWLRQHLKNLTEDILKPQP